VVRRYRVLERCTVTLVTERRRHRPAGALGGAPGQSGQNLLNGQPIPAKCRIELNPNDVVTVMTPGGGGWGHAR
jgi:N-methylhydantoinase B